MNAQQLNVDSIANNLANMNTTGFKAQRAEFQDLLYQNVQTPGPQTSDNGAVAPNGSRYADLPKAFVYRKQMVAGCTCNGHDQFGLAHIDINKDPTLKPGDVVSTGKGMVAFTGRQNQTAQFTPAGSYPHFSKEYRSQLSSMESSASFSHAISTSPIPRSTKVVVAPRAPASSTGTLR